MSRTKLTQIPRTSTRESVADLSGFTTSQDDGIVVGEELMMIDGLKRTMTGEELRERLQERVERHRRLADYYEREAKREPVAIREDVFAVAMRRRDLDIQDALPQSAAQQDSKEEEVEHAS